MCKVQYKPVCFALAPSQTGRGGGAQHGHTTFKQTSAPSAEVLGRSGECSPRILQPPRTVLRPYRSAVYLYSKFAYGELT